MRRGRHGLTRIEAEAIRAAQGGLCAVCGEMPTGGVHPKLQIDHCHKTGKVGAALCAHCNRTLGMAKDSPELLRKLAIYLERYR